MARPIPIKRALLVVGINDPESRLAVEEAAIACGWDFVHVTSEHEAVRLLAETLYSVEAVVLDLFSGQHAEDLLRTITQSETAPPVIVLAGQEQLGAVPVARHSGAAACVRKPFTAEMLTSVIKQVRKPESGRQGSTSDLWGHPAHKSSSTPLAVDMVSNLIANALKFTAKGGLIVVATYNGSCSLAQGSVPND